MSAPLFYVFGFLTLLCAGGVVFSRNAVNGAMCLLLSLVGVAALFVLLDAYLLATLLVLVYAGAVVALFLFIIMLLDVQAAARRPWKRLSVVAGTIGAALLAVMIVTLAQRGAVLETADLGTAQPVGASLKLYAQQLFTVYLLPVQVIGFLLLIALLGVVVLSKRFEGLEDVK